MEIVVLRQTHGAEADSSLQYSSKMSFNTALKSQDTLCLVPASDCKNISSCRSTLTSPHPVQAYHQVVKKIKPLPGLNRAFHRAMN